MSDHLIKLQFAVMQRVRGWISRTMWVSLILMLLGQSEFPGGEAEAASPLKPEVALETFDQVWNQVKNQYFAYERIESDWLQAREGLREKAGQASDQAGLRAVLHELLDVIGESHFSVLPSESVDRLDAISDSAPDSARTENDIASTGLTVRLIEQRIRVTQVRDAAVAAGIEPGWILSEINGHALAEQLDQLAAIEDEMAMERTVMLLEMSLNSRLGFPQAGQSIALTFLDQAGQSHALELTGDALGVESVQLGNLPPMPYEFHLDHISTVHPDGGESCVTLMKFSTWTPELGQDIADRRQEIFRCPALVIDLSGNPGGLISTMMTLSAYLFEEPAHLGSLMRSDGHIDFRAFPRRVEMDGTRVQPFAGPIAIIIDRLSASTSEMFAAGMQATGRARLFGERTPGMALPAQMLPLASGDYLMYAFADYQDSQGRRIEGAGVAPDEAAPLTDSNLHAGLPAPLLAALAWIDSQPFANPDPEN